MGYPLFAQMPAAALRINNFMQKGREENEWNEQERFSDRAESSKAESISKC